MFIHGLTLVDRESSFMTADALLNVRVRRKSSYKRICNEHVGHQWSGNGGSQLRISADRTAAACHDGAAREMNIGRQGSGSALPYTAGRSLAI